MERSVDGQGESQRVAGGTIPGAPGMAAFSLTMPAPSALPVLIAVPHAGRAYPGTIIQRMRNPGQAALKLEDRYVDRLAEQVARETGAALLVAHAPRAMVDLNRASDEVDWEMFPSARPEGASGSAPGLRVRSGLGLIPRRVPGLGELWNQRHEMDELEQRIAQIHAPYHACLSDALTRLRERWGAALLLDLHSMPPLGFRSGQGAPEFVIGDRFGATCHGTLVGSSFGYFSEMRRAAAHNRPYAGGYVLERHGRPANGVYAMQLEIDRSSYLDARLAEPGKGFAAMVHLLGGLVRRLAAQVAELGSQQGSQQDGGRWPEAAE